MSVFWKWLGKKTNQNTLKFIGSGLLIVIGGCWAAYLHFHEPAKNPVTIVSAPNGFATTGGNVNNPVINNNYSFPPVPQIKWSSVFTKPVLIEAGPLNIESLKHPGARVEIVLEGPFHIPRFAVQCDRPCEAIQIITDGASISAEKFYGTNNPAIVAAGFSDPSELDAGSKVWIDIRSKDESPIKVLGVQPYQQP